MTDAFISNLKKLTNLDLDYNCLDCSMMPKVEACKQDAQTRCANPSSGSGSGSGSSHNPSSGSKPPSGSSSSSSFHSPVVKMVIFLAFFVVIADSMLHALF